MLGMLGCACNTDSSGQIFAQIFFLDISGVIGIADIKMGFENEKDLFDHNDDSWFVFLWTLYHIMRRISSSCCIIYGTAVIVHSIAVPVTVTNDSQLMHFTAQKSIK